MKKIILLFLLAPAFAFSQSINDYKYAVIPEKFDFLNEKDKYKLNTYTKMYMEKYGFIAYFDTDILPVEIANDRCNKVYVSLVEENSMFVTKVKVILKDCTNKILYTSAEGNSREKEFKTAYPQAMREAFKSFDALKYKYNGKEIKEQIVEKTETVILKEDFGTTPVAKEPQSTIQIMRNDFFVKPLDNGYQLFSNDTSIPNPVFTIYKTSVKNVFIAAKDGKNGVVINKGNQWHFEYHESGKIFSEPLQIQNLKPE